MVEREIEFEKEVTDTRTVTICDGCGEERDEDGLDFYPTQVDSDRVTTSETPIQLCSECLREGTGRRLRDGINHQYRLVNFLKGSAFFDEYENYRQVYTIFKYSTVIVVAFGVLSVVLGTESTVMIAFISGFLISHTLNFRRALFWWENINSE